MALFGLPESPCAAVLFFAAPGTTGALTVTVTVTEGTCMGFGSQSGRLVHSSGSDGSQALGAALQGTTHL